ncbi:hypothetical protein [Mucilaginibacter aquariorum]|uniref:PDZ domain-containing protein n=1 Tax=Mucilaginibacter aquariorum TaxID=2967225 RepID=A0ABT1T0U2_9SPHI|nr:hypothetical protein [Mucilaginibacter aquariorum]MCQ6957608.1 hypothetical protein [Mucilaginibacter aquariorum]
MKASEGERFGMINGLGQARMDPQGSDFAYAHIQDQLASGEHVQVLLVKENRILEVRVAFSYKQPSVQNKTDQPTEDTRQQPFEPITTR